MLVFSSKDLKIISGGQTGVDLAALEAAAIVGLQTGGHAPKGFKTTSGNNPQLGTLYRLQETEASDYPTRTKLNVKNSDGTLRIARHITSPGEKLTHKFVTQLKKPMFDIVLTDGIDLEAYIASAVKWMIRNKITTLNVAGNSERTCPGIQREARDIMIKILTKYVDEVT
jgi:predicted Rossmann fold nucleotide-binding protein DprA/Smf involved in DNA uptake